MGQSEGKIAIVTGASQGIGLGIAEGQAEAHPASACWMTFNLPRMISSTTRTGSAC